MPERQVESALSAVQSIVGESFLLGAGSSIGGIGGPAQSLQIGDNVTIGAGVEIRARRVSIGDYVTIHRNTTIYGYDDVSIGECSWIGQNVILNCTARLEIGRACIISAYSNIWTHFSGGDVLQGCRFNNAAPATLADDVWIGVQATVAPVTIGGKALVLAGSVLTKDVGPNEVWGGNPAQDLTAKIGPPFAAVSVEEKFQAMCARLREFSTLEGKKPNAGELEERGEGWLRRGSLAITMVDMELPGCTVFDVRNRTYTKRRTNEEISFMKALLYTVKFFAAGTG